MITVENQHNALGRLDKTEFEFRGLSTDEMPVGNYGGANIANGSIYLAIDTQELYFYDEGTSTWLGGEGE